MKRVIKASIKNTDKLKQIEGPRYDLNWQESAIQELADYLDPYGIDIEIDEVTEGHVAFTTFQPEYSELVYHYSMNSRSLNHGIAWLESIGGRPISWNHDAKSVRNQNLTGRFTEYLGISSEYISAIQSQVDKVMQDINNRYGIQADVVIERIGIHPGIPYFYLEPSSDSIINVDGNVFNVEGYGGHPSYIRVGDYDQIDEYLSDMSVSKFVDVLDFSTLYEPLEAEIRSQLQSQFLEVTDIASDAVDILNMKLAKSKYDVSVNLQWDNYVSCEFTYDDETYTFDVENYKRNIFDIWFNGSNRDYGSAVDYIANNLYKRIIAKCRRTVAKVNKDLERADQEARDSAML